MRAGVLRHSGARRRDGVRGAGGAGERRRGLRGHIPWLHTLRRPYQSLRRQGQYPIVTYDYFKEILPQSNFISSIDENITG